MSNSNFVYLRLLRHVDHTVFGVEDGQKRYYDNQFGRYIAYSSGQQVKRSVLEQISSNLKEKPAPTTFYNDVKKEGKGVKITEGEVITPGDPRFADQLLGGWMVAKAGGTSRTIKRRSPLSISAMRPLHPLLSNIYEEKVSFDRSDRPDLHQVVVRNEKGNELSDDEIAKLLSGSDRSLRRKWIQGSRRTTGLFICDIAIDLRTLFSVSINQTEPELSAETIEELKKSNWIDSENTFGKCIVAPGDRREKLIDALAGALLDWRIMTNQSRTFSPMETLAVAISPDANKITGAIRAKLIDEGEKLQAKPIVDDSVPDTEVYVTLAGAGYFATNVEAGDALDRARARLVQIMKEFDFEKQLVAG